MKTPMVQVQAPTEQTTYFVTYGGTDYSATVSATPDAPLSQRLDAMIQALTLLHDTVRFYEQQGRE